MDADKGRFELCKDVAAFAKPRAPVGVWGRDQEAERPCTRGRKRSAPVPQGRANVDSYIDTLIENLRPRVTMTHRWYADLARSSKVPPLHYLVIEVDPVAEEDRYVIVRRTLNEKERFAVPLRHGDRTVYLLSEDTYRLINDGLRGRTIRDDRAIPAPGGPDQRS
ncbi:MAG TPA: hypothetical protein VFB74_02340 [Kribbellaceae bacterium]|nr:hypothetical protein [Kribbellaceae bacterium]